VKGDLIALSGFAWARTRRRLDGLPDEELLWEPVAGCWSIRPDADGEPRPDWAPMPDTPLVTTLAWRLWHLATCYGAARNARWLGVERPASDDETARTAPRLTADAALAGLEDAHRWWEAVLAAVPEEQLGDRLGPVAGPYADSTKAGFVLHQLDEMIHHGAEVGLLRDLYAAGRSLPATDPLVASLLAAPDPLTRLSAEDVAARPDLLRWSAAHGYWRLVPALVERGGDVHAAAGGATALHHAAAADRADLVGLLLSAGADPDRRDDHWQATPLGWAEFFGAAGAAEALSSWPGRPGPDR